MCTFMLLQKHPTIRLIGIMSVASLLFSPPFLSDSHVCLHASRSICQCRCICLGIQLPVSVHLCSFAMCNQSSMHHCLLTSAQGITACLYIYIPLLRAIKNVPYRYIYSKRDSMN